MTVCEFACVCMCVCESVCVSWGESHESFSRSVYSCEQFQTLTLPFTLGPLGGWGDREVGTVGVWESCDHSAADHSGTG